MATKKTAGKKTAKKAPAKKTRPARPVHPARAKDRIDQRGDSTDPAGLTTTKGRVWYIARQMAAGSWKKGKSERELAELWGLARTTVRHMSAEASRLLDMTVGDRAVLTKLLAARLVEIADQDGPDRVQAIRTLYEHLGELRQRQEISGPGGAPIETKGTTLVVELPRKKPLEGIEPEDT